MIDFHTHLLPSMDDGSCTAYESIEMLKALKQQNINIVVVTPHFYSEQNDVQTFLKRREASLAQLQPMLKAEKDVPQIVLGAEVAFFDRLHTLDRLDSLCIGQTNYILVEMPFEKWTRRTYDGLYALIAHSGLIPIIAHIERYIDIRRDVKQLEQIVKLGVLIQMNSSYVNGFFTKRKACSLFQKGVVHLLGSDCHDMVSRPPTIGKAYAKLEATLGISALKKIDQTGKKILKQTKIRS